ncbi:FAD-dependent oxidoreductase [Pseudomaricurvus alkylphenolicus]|uniref:FAD-dependent oxidoreductase n=1 Tax=Pseudomaricurvus alkylphenolicus TaxID=1306991 RepID=UPI00141FAB6B|nr:FAD-dependent oxidoreductase [Pseudomaricurvus alkylphenolicus]NIB43422.1 FAD-dependent oxidoreductase [Pseudomaricurvus alkylphenolicus]
MSLPARRVLIIGGGFSGMSAAIQLRKLSVEVDLVEIDEDWRTDGAGITVSGPSLRAIEAIGVLPQFRQQGVVFSGVEQYTADGVLINAIPTPPVPGSSIAGGGGIMRPVLAKILADETRQSGTAVRLGVTFEKIEQTPDAAHVTFSDGTSDTYDLVIGADGVFSSVRSALFAGAPTPRYTGQGVWRAVVPRFGVESAQMFLAKDGKVGFTPVSEEEMYLYYTDRRPTKERIPQELLLPTLKSLLAEFAAPVVTKIREHLSETSQILYRPLEGMLMPLPWYDKRVLLIGDCVHATTPHLASGAGMGHEDAVVLAEEFKRGGSLEQALERYQHRRWERCRMIVANSGRLGEIESTGGSKEEHAQIMSLSMSALLAPI